MREDARRHLVAIAALLVGIGLSVGARRVRPVEASYEVDFSAIPLEVAGLEGVVAPPDTEVAEYLEAEEMCTIAYGKGRGQVVVNVIYGSTWRTVHTPAQCYPASGWSVVWEQETIIPLQIEVAGQQEVMAKLMRVERDDVAQMVLFVFAHKGGTSVDYAEHSWAVATGPPGAGGLSLMMSTTLDGNEERARRRLEELAAGIYPYAVSFWYEDWRPPGGQ